LADVPDWADKGSSVWLKEADDAVRKGDKVQRLLVHILHVEPDNNTDKNGLPARDLAGRVALVDFGFGVKGKDLLWRAEFVFDAEGVVKTDNAEREFEVQGERLYGDCSEVWWALMLKYILG
jgi:hypothetical protein